MKKRLSEEEIDKLKRVIMEDKNIARRIKTLAIFSLMLEAGLTVGEIVNLRVEDVYLEKEMLTAIKAGRRRQVPFNDGVKNVLAEYLAVFRPESRQAFLFDGRHGAITTRSVQAIIYRLAARAGMYFRPGLLSDTFYYRLMERGERPDIIAALKGIRPRNMRQYDYPNVTWDQLLQAVKKNEGGRS